MGVPCGVHASSQMKIGYIILTTLLYFSVLSFHGPTLSPRHTEEVWTEKDVVSMNLRF